MRVGVGSDVVGGASLRQLTHPQFAFAMNDDVDTVDGQALLAVAGQLHDRHAFRDLAGLYERAGNDAWRLGRVVSALRLLVCAVAAAERAGDDREVREITGQLAQRHRLCESFTAAERWNLRLLVVPLDATTAVFHARAWRELAALRTLAARYDDALRCSERATVVCERFADIADVAQAHCQALLQQALAERLSGDFAAAATSLRKASAQAEKPGVGRLTRGMIAFREAGLHLVLSNIERAHDAYQRAAALFTGISTINLLMTRIRLIPCLRGLNRFDEALATVDALVADLPPDDTRVGQALLERAEVLDDLGDVDGVAETLAGLRVRYEHEESVEGARWHLHTARNFLARGKSDDAAPHLRAVLRLSSIPGRRDLTRTMLALHEVSRLPDGLLPPAIRLAASRAALTAAEVRRDSLDEAESRWSTHEATEQVYAGAMLMHDEAGDAEGVARIMEVGRADLLNQVLATGRVSGPVAVSDLPVLPPPADEARREAVYEVAAALGGSFAAPDLPLLELPGGHPADEELDRLGDVVVLSQVAEGRTGWWSAVAVRERGGVWRSSIRQAPPSLDPLLAALVVGDSLSERGVSPVIWEALGRFLLPQPDVWSGRPDRPRKVVLCPDPRLWHLPHGPLTRDGVALLDVAELVLTPSLRTSCLLLRRDRPAGGAAASLLDHALPGHAIEHAAVAAWPGGHRPLTGLADLAVGDPAALLFVSGRGDVAGETKLGPELVTLDAFARSALPPVVVLNGCWSGTAISRYGRDPFSLAVGALLGGAHTVLAGTGEIGSIASTHIASRVVGLIAEGSSTASALRRAQREVRDEHPELDHSDWAGMCVVGLGHGIYLVR